MVSSLHCKGTTKAYMRIHRESMDTRGLTEQRVVEVAEPAE